MGVRFCLWGPFIATLLAACMALPAQAQQSPRREADPGQVQRRIPEPVEPERPAGPLEIPAPSVAPLPERVRFVLTAVVIDGATIFDAATFAPIYEDYLAHEIGLDEVGRILASITEKYRERGYFLSHAVALPQALDAGILHVTVIEGRVDRVTFKGVAPDGEPRLRRFVEPVLVEQPLRLPTLERAVLLINDLPGVHVTPSLGPIDESAGTYQLTLALDTRRVAGFATFDNRGTRSLGPAEGNVGASVNSLLVAYDRLSSSFFTTFRSAASERGSDFRPPASTFVLRAISLLSRREVPEHITART